MINPYLSQLVDRMLDNSYYKLIVPYDSSKSIIWKALREAETLTDTSYIDNIIENIGTEKNKKQRDKLHFIIYRICENTASKKGLEFLIDTIDKETDKYIISAILDGIIYLQKPAQTDLTKIFNATNHKTWLVNQSAIRALQNTNNSKVEPFICNFLDMQPLLKSHAISYAITVLYNLGTPACLPSLERQTSNKSRNIKNEAKGTIETIKEKFKIQ
jgi:hypothetical protein